MFNYAYKRVYEKVNYGLRTLNGGRWASHCRPTSIGLMLSYRCNARCVHCDIWKNRGREGFFNKTSASIETLKRVRCERKLDFVIRLKTVIMRQNVDHVTDVAHYASQEGMHVFYQPIEQNYDTEEDPRWFEHSNTFPDDCEKAVAMVNELIR